jgi:hypothetical protein
MVIYIILCTAYSTVNYSYRNITTPNVSGATGNYSAILGGADQSVTGTYSAIIGGKENVVSGNYSLMSGYQNTSSGDYAVTFGRQNTSLGDYSFVFGNDAHSVGNNSFAGGRNTYASGLGSFVGGAGFNSSLKIIASGITSFNFSYRDNGAGVAENVSGVTGNYSAILGGSDHSIISIAGAILGGSNNKVLHDRSVIIGGYNMTTTAVDRVYVPNLDTQGIIYISGISLSTNGTDLLWSGATIGGGPGIEPFTTLTSGSTTTWNVTTSSNVQVTISGNTILQLTGVTNGMYGTIKIIQGLSGSTMTFGTGTHKVANGGGGAIILSSGLGNEDILSFVYDGSTYYWNAGYNYN